MNEKVHYNLNLTREQFDWLESEKERTGESKASMVREAINILRVRRLATATPVPKGTFPPYYDEWLPSKGDFATWEERQVRLRNEEFQKLIVQLATAPSNPSTSA